jgi:hypothetical protein
MEPPGCPPRRIYTSVSPRLPFKPGNQSDKRRISETPGPLTMVSLTRWLRNSLPVINTTARIITLRMIVDPYFFMSNPYLIKKSLNSKGTMTIASPSFLRQSFSVRKFQIIKTRTAATIAR